MPDGRFLDNVNKELDEDILLGHLDHNRAPHAAPMCEDGGTSNEAFLNDYRNRMPYHYIEQGTEGYYYWQYGATMEIEFEISDEIASTDPTPPFIVDFRVNGQSLVDKVTGIVDLTLGSMAKEDKANYYTVNQANDVFKRAMDLAKQAEAEALAAKERAERMSRDLYAILGQELGPGDDFTVIRDIPFTLMLKPDQTMITVNGVEFTSILCVDASNMDIQIDIPIEEFPKEVPILAVFNTKGEEPVLLTGFSTLPIDYLHKVIIPKVEQEAIITSKNLALSEIKL